MSSSSGTTPTVLVVGSSGMDMTIYLERIPKIGETLLGGEFLTCPGGKGANQAVAAARAGGTVKFVARLGEDHHGDEILAGFEADRIDASFIVRDSSTPTGTALIFVSEAGENSIGVAPGANGQLSPSDVANAGSAFDGTGAMLLQLEVPLETVEAAAALAQQKGIRVILNPAPAQPLPDSLMQMVSILTPNETEAELLTGIPINNLDDAERASVALRARGVDTVVLTLGEQGAYVSRAEGSYLVKAFKVNAIDTVAAGDVFNGALALALCEGLELKAAVRFANAAAAHSVTIPGAQPSAPKRSEIEAILK